MPEKRNYLLGYGERLTAPVEVTSGGGEKKPPYSFEEARSRLIPMLQSAAVSLEALPEKACPGGQAVASVMLHPEYYAKSHYPGGFLREAGLRTVGSRSRTITPEQRSRGREPKETVTTELFVAGARDSFHRLADQVPSWPVGSPAAKQLTAIEKVSTLEAEERMRPLKKVRGRLPLEIVLHASESRRDRFILAGFKAYLEELELEPDLERIFFAGQLCFLRLRATAREAHQVARFSFLRVLREMPKLRTVHPVLRGVLPRPRACPLPDQGPLDPGLRVAVFDGGLPDASPLTPWANTMEAPGVGESHPDLLWHGAAVTSALLFGSVADRSERPLCKVDHHRVLDKNSERDPFELYEVLERVKSVLEQRRYEFVSLSLGPTLPVDDKDVHAWTAVLDEHFSDGAGLVSIAAGNTGEEPDDPGLQNWRIQVPSDCVNGLTVGASDRRGDGWARAPYSSKGPGRSPGIVKPDLVTFGGSQQEAFWIFDPQAPGYVIATGGTSYAAPAALRAGLAVRAHLGTVLSPLAIKALLIHRTDPGGHAREEVGWGCLPDNLEDLVLCPDGSVRVVYQDEITAARYRRIRIPLPQGQLAGRVELTATFCFATPVDPEHPGNYTKSGLSVVFRPNKAKFAKNDAMHPASDSFFQPKNLYPTEQQLRHDAHKWETCLHASKRKLAKSLSGPVFDIHYNARADGRDDARAERIRYALVLTVEAPKVKDLYERVVRTYRAQLQPLTPVLEVPVRPGAG